MTARISLTLGRTGGHRPPLQLRTLGKAHKIATVTRARYALNCLIQGLPQYAPEPFRTVGTVCSSILRSKARDHLSMYSKSMTTQSSKLTSLRPFTCQRHVTPGFMLKRRLC